jgi:hypothetical protein
MDKSIPLNTCHLTAIEASTEEFENIVNVEIEYLV